MVNMSLTNIPDFNNNQLWHTSKERMPDVFLFVAASKRAQNYRTNWRKNTDFTEQFFTFANWNKK